MRSRFGRVCFGVEGHEKRSRVKIGRHGNISATCQQTRRVDAVAFRHRSIADAAEMVKKAAESDRNRQKSDRNERQKDPLVV